MALEIVGKALSQVPLPLIKTMVFDGSVVDSPNASPGCAVWSGGGTGGYTVVVCAAAGINAGAIAASASIRTAVAAIAATRWAKRRNIMLSSEGAIRRSRRRGRLIHSPRLRF